MGEWDKALAEVPLNKFVFMGHPDRIKEIRPIVSERIGNMGCLTQAQSNMLEVLPPNSSKGDGVRRLLREVNISPDNVLAIGDAENVSVYRELCTDVNAGRFNNLTSLFCFNNPTSSFCFNCNVGH